MSKPCIMSDRAAEISLHASQIAECEDWVVLAFPVQIGGILHLFLSIASVCGMQGAHIGRGGRGEGPPGHAAGAAAADARLRHPAPAQPLPQGRPVCGDQYTDTCGRQCRAAAPAGSLQGRGAAEKEASGLVADAGAAHIGVIASRPCRGQAAPASISGLQALQEDACRLAPG